jgi:hypothetical protein
MNDELLPAPAVADLPADRHRLLKDRFMQSISNDQPGVRSQPARRRWVRFAAPAAALAVTAVTITAVAWTRRANQDAVPGTAAPIVAVQPGRSADVRALVDRLAATAAGRPPGPEARPGQFVYVHSKVTRLVPGTGRPALDQVHDRETWLPARGDGGLAREYGKAADLTATNSNSFYANLTHQPEAWLVLIQANTEGQGEADHAAEFDAIGAALDESLVPPPALATVYRAISLVPGVVVVPDSVDVTGRHGVGLARTDSAGERTEFIFDPASADYLGRRSYLVRDTDAGPAGTLTGTTAILRRAVVGRAGQTP